MSFFSQSLSENRRTVALAAPMMAGYVGQMLMGWADTIMVGHVGVIPLAAAAFATTVLAIPLVFGFGLLSSVSVKASHGFGAGDPSSCAGALRGGLVMALLTGLVVALGIHALIPFLGIFGQEPHVAEASKTFLLLCAWSVAPAFLTTAAKNFCEALGKPWAPFWIMISGVLLNVVLNWVFIFGHLGMPPMGLEGAGLATLLARIATTVAILAYILKRSYFRDYLPRYWFSPQASHTWALVRLGLPAGGSHLAEVSGFAFGSFMMGWLSVDALAAHQIAMTCAATTFMIPLGLSQATSVRIGHARGAGQAWRCRAISAGSLGLAIVLMTCSMALLVFFGPFIARCFVDTPAVIAIAAQLLLMAGFFQIFDGTQVVCSGALRGFEDTRVPMVIGIFAYWVVALPLSYILAFHLKAGPVGIWVGFIAGLGVAAFALGMRLYLRLKNLPRPV